MTRPVCLRLADCWDWISAEDVLRHALAAVYAARNALRPPPGQRFLIDGGGTWATRAQFRDALAGLLIQRLNAHALAAGVVEPSGEAWPELPDGMEWPEATGAGRSPAMDGPWMARSCSAVGPAPMTCPEAGNGVVPPGVYVTIPADPLFSGPAGQDLPASALVDEATAAQEAASDEIA